MNNHSRRLTALEDLLTQRERLAEAENLREVAEAARAKLLALMAMARAGVPISEPAIRYDSRYHEVLRQRLHEIRERLERYAELRDTYGIR